MPCTNYDTRYPRIGIYPNAQSFSHVAPACPWSVWAGRRNSVRSQSVVSREADALADGFELTTSRQSISQQPLQPRGYFTRHTPSILPHQSMSVVVMHYVKWSLWGLLNQSIAAAVDGSTTGSLEGVNDVFGTVCEDAREAGFRWRWVHTLRRLHSRRTCFVRSFICSFVRSFVRSFVHSFVCFFVCSFVRSLIRSFVCSVLQFPPFCLAFPSLLQLLVRACTDDRGSAAACYAATSEPEPTETKSLLERSAGNSPEPPQASKSLSFSAHDVCSPLAGA